jgi:hypothetical protein
MGFVKFNIGALPDWCFLAILCNRKVAEIYTDFLWLSLNLKNFKSPCEYKSPIVRLSQSVCKCQIKIPQGGKS